MFMVPGQDPAMGTPMPAGPMPPEQAPTNPEMMPPQTLDGPETSGEMFASTDPVQMAQIAMQIVAETAQMDRAKLEQMIQGVAAEFDARQQQAAQTIPEIISAMVAQMGGGGADMQTLDGPPDPAGTLPMDGPEDVTGMTA